MEGFEVTVEGLRAAGRTGGSTAGDVAALPLAEAATATRDALPGGAAGDAAEALAGAWRARVAATAEVLAQQSAALGAAADGYAAAERRAVAAQLGEP
jgi:hypothetical protein